MKPDIQDDKIVVFSGAGISSESGLSTYRDSNGLWNSYSWQALASPKAWETDPEIVLAFYNERRIQASKAEPNEAHYAIASLEHAYEVVVITQNVDDLHERASSSHVIHLHGQLTYARGTSERRLRYFIGDNPITIGQLCDDGTQLRPDIVWFGERVENMEQAKQHIATAAKVMVVGTSLTVSPAASLVRKVRGRAEKIIITKELERKPYGFELIRGSAKQLVPYITARWLEQAK